MIRFSIILFQTLFAAFVVWSKAELKTFANHFSRQALAKKTSVAIVAECVGIARSYCQQLSVIGLELLFAMNTLLLRGIREAMQYNKEQLIEASRHRNVVSCRRGISSLRGQGHFMPYASFFP